MTEMKRLNLLFVLSMIYLGGAQKIACLMADALSRRLRRSIQFLAGSDVPSG